MNIESTPRRGFLARLLAAGAAIGASAVPRTASASITSDDEPWMRALTGKHRVMFHSHEPTGGLAFRWAATFLDTQKASYGLRDADSSVVVGLNGKSIGLVFNDALWAKYPIGETLLMPGSTNPNGPRGTGAVASLLARGVIVLVCNNSLRASGQRFLPEPARNDNAARTAFYDEAKNNLLPGVQLVPAMVVTLQQAQDRGCRYVYAGG